MSYEVQNASSWGEMVRAINKERKTLLWDPAETPKVERISLFDRKKIEREFNPLLLEYRDPVKQSEIDKSQNEKTAAKAEQVLRNTKNKFNIVSHQGPPAQIYSSPVKIRRNYHILTNLEHADHQSTPLHFDEDYFLDNLEKTLASAPSRSKTTKSLSKSRDFNIVSNDYFQNDALTKTKEYEKLRDRLLKKYWETHDYDALKGCYYDESKEIMYNEQKKVLENIQGTYSALKLPPSLQVSEGKSYDLLNHEVYDPHRLKVTNTIDDRSLNRMKKLMVEQRLTKEGEEEKMLQDIKKLNKISFHHWEEEIDRGYNIVNNSLRNPPTSLVPKRPSTMWARLNDSNPSDRNLTGGTSQGVRQFPTLATASNDSHARPRTRDLSGTSTQTNDSRAKKIPCLDMELTERPPFVSYQEPSSGPRGLSVPLKMSNSFQSARTIRTGSGI